MELGAFLETVGYSLQKKGEGKGKKTENRETSPKTSGIE